MDHDTAADLPLPRALDADIRSWFLADFAHNAIVEQRLPCEEAGEAVRRMGHALAIRSGRVLKLFMCRCWDDFSRARFVRSYEAHFGEPFWPEGTPPNLESLCQQPPCFSSSDEEPMEGRRGSAEAEDAVMAMPGMDERRAELLHHVERRIRALSLVEALQHTKDLLHPNSIRVLEPDYRAMQACMDREMDEHTDMRIRLWRDTEASDMPKPEAIFRVLRNLYERYHRLQGASAARAAMLATLWMQATENLLLLRRVWILTRGLPVEARQVFWGQLAGLSPAGDQQD